MKRFISFGSIGQPHTAIKTVQHTSRFVGVENSKPVYDNSKLLPIIDVVGTEKIHGTNASVCYSNLDGFWVQNRTGIITPEKDNAGCAFMAAAIESRWKILILKLAAEYNINLDTHIISLYYEWCGGKIQKKAAVSGLTKRAIIFQHFKVSPLIPVTTDTEDSRWFTTTVENRPLSDHKHGIYNVLDFPYVIIDMDFNNPSIALNKMIALTENIEENSEVAKYFDKPENTGEGYVWTMFLDNGSLLRWKTKGTKHSTSKVRTLTPADLEALQEKQDFAVKMCPAWRLEQAFQTVFGIENEKQEPSEKFTGDFIRAVFKDIMKEEQDAFIDAGYIPKDVNSCISKVARMWFFE